MNKGNWLTVMQGGLIFLQFVNVNAAAANTRIHIDPLISIIFCGAVSGLQYIVHSFTKDWDPNSAQAAAPLPPTAPAVPDKKGPAAG